MFDAIINLLRVKRTELVGDDKTTIATFFETLPRHPDDPWKDETPVDEVGPVDSWQHYGFASRLPKNAEAVVWEFGQQMFTLASRALAAAKVFGQLGEGDVAIYSIGGNTIRLAASGAVTVMMKGPAGKSIFARLSPKNGGEFHFMDEKGHTAQFDQANGFAVNAGDLDVTFKCKNFQVIGLAANFNVAAFKPTASASIPFSGGPAMLPSPGLFV